MTRLRTELEELIDGHTGRRDERAILANLRQAEAAELDEALASIDAANLFDSVDDHLLGGNHLDELLDLVARDRRAELGVHAHANLISGMQAGRTSSAMEEAVRDIVLAYRGNELTHLKNTINLAKGRHDLEGLVYADIDDDTIRGEILGHFARESSLGGARQAKTLSDIDDTAVARIHEERYPKGVVIPGILAFYEALDLGPKDEPVSRGDLTFVTARPSDALGLMKGHSRESLTKAGVTDMSIMTGSIFNVLTKDGMASKKVENVAHYAELFPEYDLVFVGDSGQGDIQVGEAIVERHADVVKAVFIHDVVALPDQRREELARKGIWVVDTYTGAGLKAHELGLVSADGVRRIVAEAAEALDDVEWESAEQERATRALHARDADLVKRLATP